MDTIGDNLGEKFAATVIEKYFETAVTEKITNNDYERYLSGGGASICKVKTWGDLTMQTYTRGSALSPDDPSESEAEIDPDQQKAFYFEIDNLDVFENYVNNPSGGLIKRATDQLREKVDTYVLGLYADVGSGNRVGTDYTTGTVAVAVTTGEVTGTGTTFTSAMVGLGFKAIGHTKWYRVKSYTSALAIVIENDSDDDPSIYDGGAISAGASYVIEAATVLTVTTSTVVGYIDDLAEKLDENKIPRSDRWIVVNAKIKALLIKSDEFTKAVESAFKDVIQKGLIGWIAGFEVYQNQQVAGDNATGYYILAGHKSAITFVMEYQQSKVEDDITGEFGKRYKALWAYGAKVIDERRKALAYLWCKV